MRFRLLFFASILANIIAGSSLHAQWTNLSTSQVLNVSDTTITQYTFSEDHKSVYILDAKYIIRKFDLESGIKLWEKDVKKQDYGGRTIAQVRLSQGGDKYLVASNMMYDTTFITVKDIETEKELIVFNKYCECSLFFALNSKYLYQFQNNLTISNGGALLLYKLDRKSVL